MMSPVVSDVIMKDSSNNVNLNEKKKLAKEVILSRSVSYNLIFRILSPFTTDVFRNKVNHSSYDTLMQVGQKKPGTQLTTAFCLPSNE